jgi:tRNA modification GTPase
VPDTVPRILVLNKADLRDERLVTPPGAVLMSARTGEGVDALQQALLNVAGWQAPGEDVFMARERHLEALARADEALDRASAQFAHAELFAEELRLAQRELDLITGEFSADDLLGEIFTRFCIGK